MTFFYRVSNNKVKDTEVPEGPFFCVFQADLEDLDLIQQEIIQLRFFSTKGLFFQIFIEIGKKQCFFL